jgi:L-amino acid N-acyltransferase YncA
MVGTDEQARRAFVCGADGLIAQGCEAGGHLAGDTPALTFLPRALEMARGRPVLLAGGIAAADDTRAALAAGAAGGGGPDAAEWQRRMHAITGVGLPFLTATLDGRVAGYAYCAPWKTRPAYRRTVEDSIYVAPDAVGHGVGGLLLDALLPDCTRAGVREVIAVVVDADGAASLALHRNRGFVDAGRLTAVGFKHGRWLDTVLLQRSLFA